MGTILDELTSQRAHQVHRCQEGPHRRHQHQDQGHEGQADGRKCPHTVLRKPPQEQRSKRVHMLAWVRTRTVYSCHSIPFSRPKNFDSFAILCEVCMNLSCIMLKLTHAALWFRTALLSGIGELSRLLRQRGLSTSGTAGIMVRRLLVDDVDAVVAGRANSKSNGQSPAARNGGTPRPRPRSASPIRVDSPALVSRLATSSTSTPTPQTNNTSTEDDTTSESQSQAQTQEPDGDKAQEGTPAAAVAPMPKDCVRFNELYDQPVPFFARDCDALSGRCVQGVDALLTHADGCGVELN